MRLEQRSGEAAKFAKVVQQCRVRIEQTEQAKVRRAKESEREAARKAVEGIDKAELDKAKAALTTSVSAAASAASSSSSSAHKGGSAGEGAASSTKGEGKVQESAKSAAEQDAETEANSDDESVDADGEGAFDAEVMHQKSIRMQS